MNNSVFNLLLIGDCFKVSSNIYSFSIGFVLVLD